MYSETRLRSILKAISWRILGSLSTSALVYLFTRKSDIALTVGGIEFLAKIGVYFAHERVWDRIPLGKAQIKPQVIWFTGLPCSGKTTLSLALLKKLKAQGLKVEHLDGDTVRRIYPHVGFTRKDRDEHIQRIGHLASRLEANGVFVIASFVSPYRESRDFVRKLCGKFVEIHVSTPLSECERRDVKGMYAKARRGEITHFTGVNDPYEEPLMPDLRIDTSSLTPSEALDRVLNVIKTT
jgi:adenylylsulfate kinase